MKAKLHIYWPVVLLILLGSCTIDEAPRPREESPVLNLLPLAVGNTWTYEYHLEKADGSWEFIGLEEEKITGDTTIGGQLYYILQGSEFREPFVRYLRKDPGGSVIDQEDRIWLSNEVFDELLRLDTIFAGAGISPLPLIRFEYSMERGSETVVVPAGDFAVYNFKGQGTDLVEDPPEGEIVNHNYFSDNVGKVKHTSHFYSSRRRVERRLSSYSVN